MPLAPELWCGSRFHQDDDVRSADPSRRSQVRERRIRPGVSVRRRHRGAVRRQSVGIRLILPVVDPARCRGPFRRLHRAGRRQRQSGRSIKPRRRHRHRWPNRTGRYPSASIARASTTIRLIRPFRGSIHGSIGVCHLGTARTMRPVWVWRSMLVPADGIRDLLGLKRLDCRGQS